MIVAIYLLFWVALPALQAELAGRSMRAMAPSSTRLLAPTSARQLADNDGTNDVSSPKQLVHSVNFLSCFSKLSQMRGGGGGVTTVANLNHLDQILQQAKQDKKLVVVDFSASWCGPCQMIAPLFKQLAQSADYAGVVFLKVDVDEGAAIAQKYQVMSMPTFVFFKDAQPIERFSGASIEKVKAVIEQLNTN